MDIFWLIVAIAAWISPYWWVKKIEKELNDEFLVIGICAVVIPIFFGLIWFSVLVLFFSLNFIIAYCREYVDWDFDEIFSSNSSSHSSTSRSVSSHSGSHKTTNGFLSQTSEEDIVGTHTTYEQDDAWQRLCDNVERTGDYEKLNEVYDHERDVDYNKVDEANDKMEAELTCRGE